MKAFGVLPVNWNPNNNWLKPNRTVFQLYALLKEDNCQVVGVQNLHNELQYRRWRSEFDESIKFYIDRANYGILDSEKHRWSLEVQNIKCRCWRIIYLQALKNNVQLVSVRTPEFDTWKTLENLLKKAKQDQAKKSHCGTEFFQAILQKVDYPPYRLIAQILLQDVKDLNPGTIHGLIQAFTFHRSRLMYEEANKQQLTHVVMESIHVRDLENAGWLGGAHYLVDPLEDQQPQTRWQAYQTWQALVEKIQFAITTNKQNLFNCYHLINLQELLLDR